MKSAKEIWETAKGNLQIQVSKANYETWLKDTVGVSYHRNRFVVGTPKAFAKEWLEKRLHSLIRKTLIGILEQEVEVYFEVCTPTGQSLQYDRPTRRASNPTQGKAPLSRLNRRHTFGAFVVGDSDRLAYAAALTAAEEPGDHFNPLFIYGGTGLGKSHLAHAIGNEASESGLRVACASGEQFTSAFVSAIKEKTTDQFRDRFRSIDVFIIEDVQFFEGKQQTQLSLFHIFDELETDNRQVVITGNNPPQSLPALQSDLRSRMECGLVVQVRPPDFEMRIAIVQAKAEEQKAEIDRATSEFIARQCQANVRELASTVRRITAYSKMAQKGVCVSLAREALQAVAHESLPAPGLTPTSILDAVSTHFGVRPDHLISKKRDSAAAQARQVAIYLIREKTNHPLQDIGKLLGGRDHSTILRSYHKISATLPADAALRHHIEQILKRLGH
jgi:chromosomal replication initiator protein